MLQEVQELLFCFTAVLFNALTCDIVEVASHIRALLQTELLPIKQLKSFLIDKGLTMHPEGCAAFGTHFISINTFQTPCYFHQV